MQSQPPGPTCSSGALRLAPLSNNPCSLTKSLKTRATIKGVRNPG